MRLRRLTWFLLITLMLVAVVWLTWGRWLSAQGISRLQWHGLGLSATGIALDGLELERVDDEGGRLALRVDHVQLAWPRHVDDGQPYLPMLHAQRVALDWQPGRGEAPPSANAAQAWVDVLRWVPQRLDVDTLLLSLPCVAGRCDAQGSLLMDRSTLPATLALELRQGDRHLALQAQLQRSAGNWQLEAGGSLGGQPLLTLDARLQAGVAEPHCSGRLQFAPRADTRELLAWLGQWRPADERLPNIEAALSLDARWQVTLAAAADPLDLQRLLNGRGEFGFEASLQAPRLRHENILVQSASFDLKLAGQLAEREVRLHLLPDTRLAARDVQVGDALKARDLRADLAGVDVALSESRTVLTGPLAKSAGRLEQAHLHPLGWRFKGRVDADGERQQLRGTLENDAGLTLELDGRRDQQGATALAVSLAPLFFRAGNPFSKSFADWPALLELANGHVQGTASLKWPAALQPMTLDANLQFEGLDGIYDRSELRGLKGQVGLGLHGQALTLDMPELSLQQANPGLPVGPLIFQGRYVASLAQPLAGKLSWQRIRAGLFAGEAWLAPGQLDLGRLPQRLALQLEGLQLEALLRAYPAEGLAGRGTLDGELPLLIDGGGVRVEQGAVAARAPGVLQFRSEKIRSLGRSNPGMKLVADALDDFHYELLDSAVSYDRAGKLTLGLRLRGRNPDVEKGRPINLNVNLEEDLPALLTSLQLTDKVSETIRQRVQERLRQRNLPAP